MWPNGTDNVEKLMAMRLVSSCIRKRDDTTRNSTNRVWTFLAGISPEHVLDLSSRLPERNFNTVSVSVTSRPSLFRISPRFVGPSSYNSLVGPKLFPTVYAADSTGVGASSSEVEARGRRSEVEATTPDSTESPKPKFSYEPPAGQTGRDRLRDMYSINVYGGLGPEWTLVKHGLQGGILAGIIVGVVVGGKEARIKHMDSSQGTIYQNEMAGRRVLQDKMTLGMFRGAVHWGWRTAAFTTLYIGTATHMSVYRGKSSVLDFAVAGVVTGSLWKFMQGPKAALTSGVLGGVLGLISGAVSLGVLSLFGITLEQLRYEHYQLQPKMRTELFGTFNIPKGVPEDFKIKSATYQPPDSSEQKNEQSTAPSTLSQPESRSSVNSDHGVEAVGT